jgi:hypothetical protein
MLGFFKQNDFRQTRAARACSRMGFASRAALLLVLISIPAGQSCTVVELQNDGFATNMLYLMHAIPIFYQQNGTLYIDNTDFPYTCAQDGGFHDFFRYDEHLVPWCAWPTSPSDPVYASVLHVLSVWT